MTAIETLIRDVPDFPQKGIVFKDITPLLADPEGLATTIRLLVEPFRDQNVQVVCGTESRGFIFGTAAAVMLGAGFVPIRKCGKLPCKTLRAEYALEYGTDALEIHADAIRPGQRVLMVDDLLATGGTMAACCRLVEQLGGLVLGTAFVVELSFLKGRDKLTPYPVHSLIKVDGE